MFVFLTHWGMGCNDCVALGFVRGISVTLVLLAYCGPPVRSSATMPITSQPEPRYTLKIIELPFAANSSTARGVSISGKVVGSAKTEHGRRGFVAVDSSITIIPTFWRRGEGMDSFLGASTALGINTRGEVVGFATTTGSRTFDTIFGPDRALIWRSGVVRPLPLLPSHKSSRAFAINELGTIVGEASDQANLSRPCIWSQSRITMVPMPKGCTGSARGINRAGLVVGQSITREGNERAFLWNGTKVRALLPVGGGLESFANGINDAGHVVGASSVSGKPVQSVHACMWQGKTAVDIHLRNYESSEAFAINNTNVVVGIARPSNKTKSSTGFLYKYGHTYDLNSLVVNPNGWRIVVANAVNDKGLVAVEVDRSGIRCGAILTPVKGEIDRNDR
jgi:probable HAF family extracellular repeat protein